MAELTQSKVDQMNEEYTLLIARFGKKHGFIPTPRIMPERAIVDFAPVEKKEELDEVIKSLEKKEKKTESGIVLGK